MITAASDLRILGIGGSLREQASSYLALEHVMGLLVEMGCQARIFDLRVKNLPFCNGDNRDPRPDYPAVSELRRAVSSAHALVLATPEYHGGVSGILKNALDLLSTEQLKGKVAGVISVLGGAAGSNAVNDLSRILRCCHAWVVPEYIAISRAQSVFVSGSIIDADLLNRFNRFAQGLVWAATRITGSGAQITAINQTKEILHETTVSSSLSLFQPGIGPACHPGSVGDSTARSLFVRGR
jgi:FMN reductase